MAMLHIAQEVIIINHGKKVFDGNLNELRTVLGQKKNLRITLETSLENIDDLISKIDGVKMISKKSPLEFILEADLQKIKTPALLKKTFGHSSIKRYFRK